MGINHLAMRPSARLFITLLAALSIIAAQLTVFSSQATAQNDGWQLNRLVLEFDDGSYFDSDVDPWTQIASADIIVYDDLRNEMHISCSEDLTGRTVYRIDNGTEVTLKVEDFWMSVNRPSGGEHTGDYCIPLDEFPSTVSLTIDKTQVDNRVEAEAGDETFTFDVVCTDGTTDTGIEITGTDTYTVTGIAENADCDVTETDNAGADLTEAGTDQNDLDETDTLEDVNVGTDGATVYFVNTYDAPPPLGDGTIVVAKVVDGDGDAPEDDFGFNLICDDGTNETFTLGDGEDDTFIREGGFEGCEVTETDDLDADATSWAITGDLTDSGTGTATGDDPGFDVGEDQTVTVTFTNTFDASPNPEISLVKSAVAIDSDELIVGELVNLNGNKLYLVNGDNVDETHTITYDFVVTNTGDVTLFNVTLTDPMLGGEVTLEDTVLEPGQITIGTATYDLTDEDMDSSTLPNTATVTGEDQAGTEVSDTDDEVIGIVQVEGEVLEPSISVVKDAVDGVSEDDEGNLLVTIAGQDGSATVTYQYVVTNTGDDDLTDLTLIDDKIGDLTDELTAAVTAAYGTPVLPAGESVTITVDHEVTAADFDGITLTNVVDVTGVGVDSGATVTDDDDETVTLIEVLDVVEELPKTGLNMAGLTGLGLLLAMLGAASLLFTRRRDGGTV